MPWTDLTIDVLGPLGDGVSLSRRGPIYIERTAPGDNVRAQLARDRQGIWRATSFKLLRKSQFRQVPPCPHYETCGNCSVQHLEENFYRAWKEQTVREILFRNRVIPRAWKTPIFLGDGTRRRATFSAVKFHGKVLLGYYGRRSQKIAEIETCQIILPEILSLRRPLQNFLSPLLAEKERLNIFIQRINHTTEIVFTGGNEKAIRQSLKKNPLPASRITWRATELDSPSVLVEAEKPKADFGQIQVALPPACFLQPTQQGEEALAQAVVEALPEKGHFADLFSGAGTFTGRMLEKGPVDAYENNSEAVAALSAATSPVPLRAITRDLFKNPVRRDELKSYDAVVFDPPRSGAPEQSEELSRSSVKTIVGVSCNPASFAKDAQILKKGNYRLESVQLFDQFHWSHHIELVGIFKKGISR